MCVVILHSVVCTPYRGWTVAVSTQSVFVFVHQWYQHPALSSYLLLAFSRHWDAWVGLVVCKRQVRHPYCVSLSYSNSVDKFPEATFVRQVKGCSKWSIIRWWSDLQMWSHTHLLRWFKGAFTRKLSLNLTSSLCVLICLLSVCGLCTCLIRGDKQVGFFFLAHVLSTVTSPAYFSGTQTLTKPERLFNRTGPAQDDQTNL